MTTSFTSTIATNVREGDTITFDDPRYDVVIDRITHGELTIGLHGNNDTYSLFLRPTDTIRVKTPEPVHSPVARELVMTRQAYDAIHPDYRSVWTTERTDWAGWDSIRHQYMGMRTLMTQGCLWVEGMGLTITA